MIIRHKRTLLFITCFAALYVKPACYASTPKTILQSESTIAASPAPRPIQTLVEHPFIANMGISRYFGYQETRMFDHREDILNFRHSNGEQMQSQPNDLFINNDDIKR